MSKNPLSANSERFGIRQVFLIWPILCTLTAFLGCATLPPPDPFQISQKEFYGKIKTLALTPVCLEIKAERPEQVRAEFETRVVEKIQKTGIAVIPSREWQTIWDKMTDQVGGLYDAISGKRDEAKYRAVREYTLREIRSRFKVEGFLHTCVRVVSIPIKNKAGWDGISEEIPLTGGWTTYQGTTSGLSLWVAIEDVNDLLLYQNRGGIQLLMKLDGMRFVEVPRAQLLTDPERNARAVDLVLNPLIEKSLSSR